MTETAHPAKRQPLAKNRPLFFAPTDAERALVERIADEEERAIATVVRRIFRAGLAAQGIQPEPAPAAEAPDAAGRGRTYTMQELADESLLRARAARGPAAPLQPPPASDTDQHQADRSR